MDEIPRTPWPTYRETMISMLGIEIEQRSPELTVSRLPFSARARQPMGLFHAGAMMTLADTTATALCITIINPKGGAVKPEEFPLAVQLSTNLIRNADAGSLVCESRALHAGRSTIVVESRVTTEAGKLAAVITSTHFRPDSRSG
jgi:1,4-dihydroxy-2-naphthoyl-CoA hydrolase